jgi:hypothetical protein
MDGEGKAVSSPPCPECKGVTHKVTFDGYGTLYECTKSSCLNQFRVPAGKSPSGSTPPPQRKSSSSSASQVPPTHSTRTCDVEAGSPEPERELDQEKEKSVANEWTCEICSAVFSVPQALGAHKRFVHGGKQKPGLKPDPAPAAAKPKERRARAAKAEKFKDVIDRLRAKRQAAIDDFVAESEEIGAIDTAIKALEVLG